MDQGWGTRTRYSRMDFWYSYFTRTLLVLVDKFSGTRTSTGTSRPTDILWYICDLRVKTIIPVKWTISLTIKEKFQIDLLSPALSEGKNWVMEWSPSVRLFCYDLNKWYMRCDSKFHDFIPFYHQRTLTELLLWCLCLLLSFVQVHSPI